jgi:hypothetical protein
VSDRSPSRQGASPWVANLAVLGVSLLLVAIAIEVGVRSLVDFDRHAPFAVLDVDHSGGGLSFLPSAERRYETSEFSFHARYNAFGRRDVEWPAQAIADPTSVLFIGDSFAYGIGVEHEGTLPSRLERIFASAGRPLEVMNFGMPGAGAPPTYAVLLDDAIDRGFAARTVVALVFVGNDFSPGVLAPRHAPVGEPSGAGPAPDSSWPEWKTARFLRLRVSQSARLVGWALTVGRWLGITVYDSGSAYIFLRERTPEQDAMVQQILSSLGAMEERCRETKRRLFVSIMPNRIQVENHEALSGAVYDAARPNRDILAYCRTQGIACLDLLPVLREAYEASGAPLYYPIDRHLNPQGYGLAADAIGAFLLDHDVP